MLAGQAVLVIIIFFETEFSRPLPVKSMSARMVVRRLLIYREKL